MFLLSVNGIQKLRPEDTKYGIAALGDLNQISTADIVVSLQDGGQYPAHRAYLQRLPRFLCHEKFQESTSPVFELYLPAPHHFRPFLEYIYRGDGSIDLNIFRPECFVDTLRNSNYLDIDDIVKQCIDRFPDVLPQVLLSDEFHHSCFDFHLLSRLVRGSTIDIGSDESDGGDCNHRKRSKSSSTYDVGSMIQKPDAVSSLPTRNLTAVETLDAILTWVKDLSDPTSTPLYDNGSPYAETLRAARKLVSDLVSPRLLDGSLTLKSWSDLVSRHGHEDESYSAKKCLATAQVTLRKARAANPQASEAMDASSQPRTSFDDQASITSARDDNSSITLTDADSIHETAPFPAEIPASHAMEEEEDAVKAPMPFLFTAHDPLSLIVPQQVLIYASAILQEASKRDAQKRLRARHRCVRCGEFVTVAEIEARGRTCLAIISGSEPDAGFASEAFIPPQAPANNNLTNPTFQANDYFRQRLAAYRHPAFNPQTTPHTSHRNASVRSSMAPSRSIHRSASSSSLNATPATPLHTAARTLGFKILRVSHTFHEDGDILLA
ncbi:hypothetical protein HDU97_002267 [Phlyctochytrium planicorne]|nr:hypothetical protein HDU97_002267 [Phlyctochytrium planicorne]